MNNRYVNGLCLMTVISAVMAVGCATTGVSPAFQPEPGTIVEVTKPLKFPKRSRRVYIQDGERVRRHRLDRFVAFCSIGLERETGGKSRMDSVQPGTFTAGETRLSMRLSDAGPRTPLQVASNADNTGAAFRLAQGGAPPSMHMYDTIIPLHSGEQPQVADLICSYDGGIGGRHLTMSEITDTLGNLVRFR